MIRIAFIISLFTGFNASAVDQYADWGGLLLERMKCACDVGGERIFNDKIVLGSDECTCDLGKSMRQRVLEYVGEPGSRTVSDILGFLESLTDEDPANERYILYEQSSHKILMENTMCTCGCGKMALSQCPLDCPWSPIYQRRFKFLLALNYDVDKARQYYLDDANRVHRKGKQPFDLNTITLNQEESLSWMVPVSVGGFAFLIVITIFARRGRAKFGPVKAVPVVETAASLDLTEDDRELLADELDDFSE